MNNWWRTAQVPENAAKGIQAPAQVDAGDQRLKNLLLQFVAKNSRPVIEYMQQPTPQRASALVDAMMKTAAETFGVMGKAAALAAKPILTRMVQEYFVPGRIPDWLSGAAKTLQQYDLPDNLNPYIDKVLKEHGNDVAMNITFILLQIKSDPKKLAAELAVLSK